MNRRTSRFAAWALASVSTLALTTPGSAQAYNWTGFYVGVNAGGAFGRSDATSNASCAPAGFLGGWFCDDTFPAPAGAQANGVAVSASGTGPLDGTGFTGGVQFGHLWQTGSFVYGLEADFGAFDIGASRAVTGAYPVPAFFFAGTPYTITTSIDTDALLTARVRVGWAFSNLLAYVTGGAAGTRLRVANSFSDDPGVFPGAVGAGQNSVTKFGWTLGGGLEYALGRNWTIRAEYLYVDFGSVTAIATVAVPGPGAPAYANAISTSVDATAHIARAGINFRF